MVTKLNPNDEYDGEWYWVAHPHGGGSDEVSQTLIKHRYDLEIIGGVCDAEASYSYDDFALVRLDDQYYLLSTAGCSCPSPTETWCVEIGPATLDEIEVHLKSGNYEGYTVPARQMNEFLALIAEAKL